jgi:hypothetical protein
MSISEGGGRTANQAIRHIAASLFAQKHNLVMHYRDQFENKQESFHFCTDLGIELYSGTQQYGSHMLMKDTDNYWDLYRRSTLDVNVKTDGWFQIDSISRFIHAHLNSEPVQTKIKAKNRFNSQYGRNTHCFIHVRLGDVAQYNPGFDYYHGVLQSIGLDNIDTVYVSTDSPDHKIIQRLRDTLGEKMSLMETNDLHEIIMFGSTAKYVVLSYGSFSALIGYLAYESTVYYREMTPSVCWDWEEGNRMFGSYFSTDKGPWVEVPYKNKRFEQLSIVEWRGTEKPMDDLILQASTTDHRSSWTSWPIGFQYSFCGLDTAAKQTALAGGTFDKTVFCAMESQTDNGRRGNLPVNRRRILETLQRNGIENKKFDRDEYFSRMKQHKFVISPEGNGIDCHRHYEALMCGCIPILERHPGTEKKYANLPILYTTDYSEITEDYLCEVYEKMQWKKYDFRTLFLSNYRLDTQKEIMSNGNYWGFETLKQPFYPDILEPLAFITLTSSGYIDYTRNCIKSLKKCGVTHPLQVYCVGREGYDKLRNEGHSHVEWIDNEKISGFHVFLQGHWGDITFQKFVVIHQCLKKYKYVCFTDGDIVYENKDVLEYCMREIGDHDMLIQNDSNLMTDEDYSELCTGFMFIQCTPTTLRLFDPELIAARRHNLHWNDQVCMNEIKHLFRYKVLPFELFPNGHYYCNRGAKNPMMIHFNYRVGHAKRDTMEKYQKWYL